MAQRVLKPHSRTSHRVGRKVSSRRSVVVRAGGQHVPFRTGVISSVSSAAMLLLGSAAQAQNELPDPDTVSAALNALSALDSTTAIVGASVVATGGVIAAAIAGGGEKSKVVATAAKQAWEALNVDENTVLIDIRAKEDVKEVGTPELKPAKKKLLSLPYTQIKKTKEGPEVVVSDVFVERFSKLKGKQADSLVVLLDKDGTAGAEAAKALLQSEELGLEKVYYVKGGADAWLAAELPWKEPAPAFQLPALDFSSLDLNLEMLTSMTTSVSGTVKQSVGKAASAAKENSSLVNLGLTAAATVGGAVFLITEFELILQVVGVAAATTFLVRAVLDGKVREGTFKALKAFFTDKIKVDEMGDDLKTLARAILDSPDAQTAAKVLQAAPPAAAALPEPKAEAPQPEAPKPEAPEPEVPKAEAPEPEASKATAPEPEAPEAEATAEPTPVPEAPKAEAPAEPTPAPKAPKAEAAVELPAASEAPPAPLAVTAVPENVRAARVWIDAWKVRSGKYLAAAQAAAAAAPVEALEAAPAPLAITAVPENVRAARVWIDAWKVRSGKYLVAAQAARAAPVEAVEAAPVNAVEAAAEKAGPLEKELEGVVAGYVSLATKAY